MKKIAIVGHGYVGKACEYGFNTKKNKIQLIDPFLYNNSVDDMTDVDVSFVCVPTPFGADGQIDASIVVDVTNKLIEKTTGLIVIKSTVIPSIVKELSTKNSRVIYNPEFLTERNALEDFIIGKFAPRFFNFVKIFFLIFFSIIFKSDRGSLYPNVYAFSCKASITELLYAV